MTGIDKVTETTGWDPTWEHVFSTQAWGKYPPEYVVRFVARNFYSAPDRGAVRILDLGCGTGASTWFMAREGFSVSGIDGSPTAVARALSRLDEEALAAELRVGDFTSLPWPDGHFEGVLDNASLYANPWGAARRAVAEIYRVLKPGGRLFSSCFSTRTWGFRTGEKGVRPGEFLSAAEGPLAGKGFCRFLTEAQVLELYRPLYIENIELASFTLGGRSHVIELWLVTCSKTDGGTLNAE